jgi:hypothetical protein
VSDAAAAARRWAIAVLALVAAACASPHQRDEEASTAAARDQRQSASRPGAVGDMQPDALLGLSADQLTSLLGPADFTRGDGPAEIRQFRSSECVLDVFLYREPSQGGYVVEHVQTRERGLVRAADRACVADLLRARRTRPPAG